jgi:peptidoglycan/LPS O-acetylase OafA/YrhL
MVGLDLLRLLAIVLVLGRHMAVPPETLPSSWMSILLIWQRGGWVGVDLFFVLSGFLVSGLLFSEYKSRGTLSFGRFYTRRGWKIYPPFFVLIFITVVIHLLFGLSLTWMWIASELLFIQNYTPGIWGYTWSLAVEEHFYLLLPLSLILMLRFNKNSLMPFKPILALAVFVAIFALLLRLINLYYGPVYSYMTHVYPTHLRIDSLFFGVLISYLYHFYTNRFIEVLTPWRWWLIIAGVFLLTPAFIFPIEVTPFIYTVGFTIFYLGSGMLLVGVLLCNIPRRRTLTFMATLGTYSYSIYLWHMPMFFFGVPLIDAALGDSIGFGTQLMIYLIGSLVIGVIMAKIVEVPVLRLRDRWFPPRSKGPIEG